MIEINVRLYCQTLLVIQSSENDLKIFPGIVATTQGRYKVETVEKSKV